MPIDERFTEGLRLFNEGEFFECHDVIEALWLETDSSDPYRDLYKGVIQAAAALYQYQRGILSGALGLHRTSVSYLKKYKPAALGLNVPKLVADLDTCFAYLEKRAGQDKPKIPEGLIPKLEYKLF